MVVVCCSVVAAQPPVRPASIEMKRVDNNGGCTLSSALHSQLANEVEGTFNTSILPQLYGLYESFPASSCADIYQGHPSGYYWLNVANEPQLVYCSLNENRCCSESDGKWMRIAYLNMSDPSEQCPDGWREVQSPIRTSKAKWYKNQLSQLHLLWNSLFQGVWKNCSISIWNSRWIWQLKSKRN